MTRLRLSNPNPTETEKAMFRYNGIYLIKIDYTLLYYAPLHIPADDILKEFPLFLEVDEADVDYSNSIIFDMLTNSVEIVGKWADVDEIALISKRMKELNMECILKGDQL